LFLILPLLSIFLAFLRPFFPLLQKSFPLMMMKLKMKMMMMMMMGLQFDALGRRSQSAFM
jgi:hypothetical protein